MNVSVESGQVHRFTEKSVIGGEERASGDELASERRADVLVERQAASISTLYFNPAASSTSWMARRTRTDSG